MTLYLFETIKRLRSSNLGVVALPSKAASVALQRRPLKSGSKRPKLYMRMHYIYTMVFWRLCLHLYLYIGSFILCTKVKTLTSHMLMFQMFAFPLANASATRSINGQLGLARPQQCFRALDQNLFDKLGPAKSCLIKNEIF